MTTLQMASFSKQVVADMTGNAHFPSPSPALSVIDANTLALDTAIAVVKRGIPATTADMHAKRKVLHDLLKSLGVYVEVVANQDPPNALTIAKSSGMGIKLDPKPRPAGFRLQPTNVPGQVKLFTTSVPRGAYKWEYTTTPAVDASWVSVENNAAKILITGLTSASRYYFRVAVATKSLGPWSDVINTVIS